MIRKLVGMALALTTIATISAVAVSDPFMEGNAAAASGNHIIAAADFEHAIEINGWSAGALFNLGNAYASSGHPGRAILAYERAHLIAPRDHAIEKNLDHTREAAGVALATPSRIQRALTTLSPDEWTWIAFAAAMFAFAGAIGFVWPVQRSIARVVAISAALASAGSFAAAVHVAPSAGAAVMVTSASARIAPFSGAEAAFTASEGESVKLEQRHGEFVYVRDGDRMGWVPAAAVEPLVAVTGPTAHS